LGEFNNYKSLINEFGLLLKLFQYLRNM